MEQNEGAPIMCAGCGARAQVIILDAKCGACHVSMDVVQYRCGASLGFPIPACLVCARFAASLPHAGCEDAQVLIASEPIAVPA